LVKQRLEKLTIPKLSEDDEITADSGLKIAPISTGQLNTLRSLYLNYNIIPAAPQFSLVVLVDGKIIGALGMSRSNYLGEWCNVYMMADFAVSPTKYGRLSKLVLAASLSKEVQAIAEQKIGIRVKAIGTTAFTEKPVSMKYRGLYRLHNRKNGALNYKADAGRWSLKEALDWWMKKHSRVLRK